MPIYEFICSNCGEKTDILLGINDPTPPFCPECGAEGTLRKAFAPPAIVFKGSGWAKKDRAATRSPGSGSSGSSGSGGSADRADGKGSDGDAPAANKSGGSSDSTSSSSSSTGGSGD